MSKMTIKNSLLLTLAIALLSGCSFATRTRVATLDSTQRAAKVGNIEVFRHGQMPTRQYKEIAAYSLASHGGESANVLQGFIELARKQGADALIFDDSGIQMIGGKDNIKDGGVGIFQGTAIVWIDSK